MCFSSQRDKFLKALHCTLYIYIYCIHSLHTRWCYVTIVATVALGCIDKSSAVSPNTILHSFTRCILTVWWIASCKDTLTICVCRSRDWNLRPSRHKTTCPNVYHLIIPSDCACSIRHLFSRHSKSAISLNRWFAEMSQMSCDVSLRCHLSADVHIIVKYLYWYFTIV